MNENNTVTGSQNLVAQEFREHIKRSYRREKIMGVAHFIVLAALIALFSITAQGFMSVNNVLVLLNQMSIPLMVATGITFVVLLGGLDLSLDGVMGLSGAMLAIFVLNDKNDFNFGILGIVIAVAVAGCCGFVTGFVFVKCKIPSFMVSFAMGSITYGLAMLSYGGLPATINDPVVRAIALNKIQGLPVYFYLAVIVFAIAVFIQQKTAFGKHMYAIGENEELARIAGINVGAVKVKVFMLAGAFAGLAGVCGAAQIARGDVSVGVGQVFPALAAVVVGGTTLAGGKGGVHRTLVGVLIITILNNGLVLIGANPYIQTAIMGVVLIVAVVFTVKRGAKQVVK
ncbi:MAG: ABC transporter permease [Clostridiales Family XIII bacterium]|nr:ABC transporter permease [Clostridiales Family XIII bacterium]